MKKIDKSRFGIAFLLIVPFFLYFLSRSDYCLRSGEGKVICGNFAIIVMIFITFGGVYLIYKGFKK